MNFPRKPMGKQVHSGRLAVGELLSASSHSCPDSPQKTWISVASRVPSLAPPER